MRTEHKEPSGTAGFPEIKRNFFPEYYKVQLSEEFIGRKALKGLYEFYHPVLMEIGAENFYAAVLTLVYKEQIGRAKRLLEIREQTGALSPEAAQLKANLEILKKQYLIMSAGISRRRRMHWSRFWSAIPRFRAL